MTKYRYSALVTEEYTYPVQFEVDVPDGRSPWGPAARQAAKQAAPAAMEAAKQASVQAQTDTRVRTTSVREVE